MREKVGKSRFTVVFQWFVAPGGRKVGSLKRRVRSHLARGEMKSCTPLWREAHLEVKMYKNTRGSDHFWKLRCRKSARRCGAKYILKSKVVKTGGLGPLLEVEMSKKCTPLWREAYFQVKMYKTHHSRTTFGSSDVEKVHAVVARSTFRSQHVQNTTCSRHFWKLRCRKSARRCGAKHISKMYKTPHVRATTRFTLHYTLHYTPLHYAPLHYTTLHNTTTTTTQLHSTTLHYTKLHYTYTTLHYTTLHYTTLHYLPLHFTTLHYTTLQLQLQLHNYTPLQYTPLHSTTQNYTTLHYTTLHYTTLHYTTLPSTTLHYITLHYTPLHYNYNYDYTTTLHYTKLHYTTLHYTTLQYTEWHCTTDRQVDRYTDRQIDR